MISLGLLSEGFRLSLRPELCVDSMRPMCGLPPSYSCMSWRLVKGMFLSEMYFEKAGEFRWTGLD